MHDSHSEVSTASKLHRHFTRGFDSKHSLRLPFAAVLSVSKGLISAESMIMLLYDMKFRIISVDMIEPWSCILFFPMYFLLST